MIKEWILLCVAVVILFLIQLAGCYFQMNTYRKAVRRLHRQGNVGIGQKKGGFSFGYLVLIVCDSRGTILGAEVMKGITFLAQFRPQEELLGHPLKGSTLSEFLTLFAQLNDKQRKQYKGYIQAIEALDQRLNPDICDEGGAQNTSAQPQVG